MHMAHTSAISMEPERTGAMELRSMLPGIPMTMTPVMSTLVPTWMMMVMPALVPVPFGETGAG